jgi:outer membrane protein assembly factor BamA
VAGLEFLFQKYEDPNALCPLFALGGLVRSCLLALPLSFVAAPLVAQESARAPSYFVESIELRGNLKTQADLVLEELLFSPNSLFSEELAEGSKLRLLATGLFSSVDIRLRKGSARGQVVVIVELEERNTLLLSELYITTSPEVPGLGGLGLAQQNFLGRGVTVEGSFVAGADLEGDLELSLRGRVESPSLGERGVAFGVTGLYLRASEFFGVGDGREVTIDGVDTPQPFARLRYQRAGGEIRLARDLGDFARLVGRARFEQIQAEVPLAASGPVGGAPDQRIDFGLEGDNSQLFAASVLLIKDTRDHPFLPREGSRLFAQATLGAQALGGSYNYGKLEFGLSKWRSLSWGHIVKGEAFAGLILGDAPFFERFYVGDLSDLIPDRQLDISPTASPAPDIFSTGFSEQRFGDVAGRVAGEYLIPLREAREDERYLYGIHAYFGAGLVGLANRQELLIRDPARPTGIPLDLTLDLGLRVDTIVGVFGLSFSNAAGILP